MRTELRFLLAIALMLVVLVGTNLLFPPVPPEEPLAADSVTAGAMEAGEADSFPAAEVDPGAQAPSGDDVADAAVPDPSAPSPSGAGVEPGQEVPTLALDPVAVEGPLYRFVFDPVGARIRSVQLEQFQSFARAGNVELLPDGGQPAMGTQLLVDGQMVDLRSFPFRADPEEGLTLSENGGPQSLRFILDPDGNRPGMELVYTFRPDSYTVLVEGRLLGIQSAVVFTDLGSGMAMNEVRPQDEERALAYVVNQTQEGITVRPLRKVESRQVEEGPLLWAVFKSKYFVFGMLAGSEPDTPEARFGGAVAEPSAEPYQAGVAVSQPVGGQGRYAFRLFAGPQDYETLRAQGADFQNVNAYGWRLFRPVIRPFVGIITRILVFLHDNLHLGYGWVLIIFGVLMRLVLFPLNHKAMRAQLKNMAVQPLLQEIQTKYKDQPERMQKELMKLYKEHGFNPLAGCFPMLLPMPVLIALFFVFQNTVQLRGVPFLWIPDLSAPDPIYLLPILLALSMFLLQWISLRSMDTPNPQMKMMMWMMPIFMLFIFANLASGLNLYYATANLATLPQQYWIAQERKRATAAIKVPSKKE